MSKFNVNRYYIQTIKKRKGRKKMQSIDYAESKLQDLWQHIIPNMITPG